MTNLEKLDTFPELQKALEQEREARKRTERERDEYRDLHAQAVATAAVINAARERAEAERDALKQEHDEDQGVIRVWRGRCERAEADNAALLDDSRAGLLFWHGNACAMAGGAYPCDPRECSDVVCREWMSRIRSAHPGAALLEYVRALKNVICAVRRSQMDGEDSDYARGYGDGWTKRGAVMRAAADALKVTP